MSADGGEVEEWSEKFTAVERDNLGVGKEKRRRDDSIDLLTTGTVET